VPDALDPHFFRHEWGRLVAVLVRVFGVHNLPLAEDVAQDALFRAMEVWKRDGPPAEPAAWLTAVAKRRAIDELRRERTRRAAAPEIERWLESEWTRVPVVEELFAPQPFRDDELRMMFSLAQPRLPEESRVGLILHVLGGFSAEEIAAAFFTTPVAVGKRIARAKNVVADSRSLFELEAADLPARLETVQSALYLLFNEGYHGASPERVVREDLCREAIRLVDLLGQHPATRTPSTLALSALLRLHAARLPSRIDAAGDLLPFDAQDRTTWDGRLAAEGLRHLEAASSGDELTPFHLEAAIAACHATAKSVAETPWKEIAELYDMLLRLRPSPVVALNRAIALGKAFGPVRGLAELEAIDGAEALAGYPFYEAALGELALAAGKAERAAGHFTAAQAAARNGAERSFLQKRLEAARAASRDR
jgi:RNA polymerase sigma-70 factor (ECF subfamily)